MIKSPEPRLRKLSGPLTKPCAMWAPVVPRVDDAGPVEKPDVDGNLGTRQPARTDCKKPAAASGPLGG
jgi:hypothetical protein